MKNNESKGILKTDNFKEDIKELRKIAEEINEVRKNKTFSQRFDDFCGFMFYIIQKYFRLTGSSPEDSIKERDILKNDVKSFIKAEIATALDGCCSACKKRLSLENDHQNAK